MNPIPGKSDLMRFTNFVLVGVACIVAAMLIRHQALTTKSPNLSAERASEGSLSGSFRIQAPSTKELHAVIIHKPAGPPQVKLASVDPQQRIAVVACSTCHSIRPSNLENRSTGSLDEFHQGLEFSHGQLACYACHNPHNADTLRLADGSMVEYPEVMVLCSQCHSKQASRVIRPRRPWWNEWFLGPFTRSPNEAQLHYLPRSPRSDVSTNDRDVQTQRSIQLGGGFPCPPKMNLVPRRSRQTDHCPY